MTDRPSLNGDASEPAPACDRTPDAAQGRSEAETLIAKVHAWRHETWRAAWGHNAPLIVNDDEIAMPALPEGYEWLVTRELTGTHPTYRVALTHVRYEFGGEYFRVAQRGQIDKAMYGEAGVRELAQQLLSREGLA